MDIERKRTPSEIRGALLGTLLGDSYIEVKRFGVEQASKELVDYKETILKQIPNIKITRSERIRVEKTLYRLHAYHPIFEKLRKKLYIPTKQVQYKLLDKLTDEGLALWYMDDGTKITRSERRYVVLCTDNFDMFSHKQMIRFFKERYDLKANIMVHRDRKYGNKNRIFFTKDSAQKFVSIVFPYTLPEFYYKLDLRYTMPFYMINEYQEIQNYIQEHNTRRYSLI